MLDADKTNETRGKKMFEILWIEKTCTMGMLIFFFISVGILIGLALEWKALVKQSENMSITKRKELKAMKTKFMNSYVKTEKPGEKYQISAKVNVEVFVDKALKKIKFYGLKAGQWRFASIQLLLGSVVMAGVGAYRVIVTHKAVTNITPFYVLAFLGLYIYFSVSGLCEFSDKEQMVRYNVIEYIENHMINRIEIANAFQEEEDFLKGVEIEKQNQEIFSEEKERELEQLLQEFFI